MLAECEREAAIDTGVDNPIPHTVVADIDQALAAAVEATMRAGYNAHVVNNRLSGDAIEAGHEVMATLDAADPGVYLWGGETTVHLPAKPGRGGRCQNLALSVARLLEGQNDIILLAAGTDGSDGPGVDAGAMIDGGNRGTWSASRYGCPGSLAKC